MICPGCYEDRSCYHRLADGEDYCRDCAGDERLVKRIEARVEADRKIGHTGDTLCGCERCAARADMGYG